MEKNPLPVFDGARVFAVKWGVKGVKTAKFNKFQIKFIFLSKNVENAVQTLDLGNFFYYTLSVNMNCQYMFV